MEEWEEDEGLLSLEGLKLVDEDEGARTDRAQELLAIFAKVRDRLHCEGGITVLPLVFPIRELNHVPYTPRYPPLLPSLCPSHFALSLEEKRTKTKQAVTRAAVVTTELNFGTSR
jgi:hypothetical protein